MTTSIISMNVCTPDHKVYKTKFNHCSWYDHKTGTYIPVRYMPEYEEVTK